MSASVNPTVVGALIALGGALAALLWSVVQHRLTRRQRIEETLRTERQARYSEFIGLADALLIDLERSWSSVVDEIDDLSTLNDLLGDVELQTAPESVRAELHQKCEATKRSLGAELARFDEQDWRRRADAIRASRITVELVGSSGVGQLAQKMNDDLYALIGSLTSTESVAGASKLIGDIRGARQLLLDEAKRDVQLTHPRSRLLP